MMRARAGSNAVAPSRAGQRRLELVALAELRVERAPLLVPAIRDALERMEHQLIRQALQRTEGNRAAAATLLGINRTTLVEKLKRNPVELGGSLDSSTD